MRAMLSKFLVVSGVLLVCCVPCAAQSVPDGESPLVPSDFTKVSIGMTFVEVHKILGNPCFEREEKGQPGFNWHDRAWRTTDRTVVVYVCFRENKVSGVATFTKAGRKIAFVKGEYDESVMNPVVQNQLFDLLFPPK
jgi:hypothetical protein